MNRRTWIGSLLAAFVAACDRRNAIATHTYRSSIELQRDLVGGAPLAGAAYSHIVPTRFEGVASVVGFVYGFRPGPEGGSVDSPSDVRHLDPMTGRLVEEHAYTGEHRSRRAPKTSEPARARMYALQDALMPDFFGDSGKSKSPEDASQYLQAVPDAVGPELLIYYEELAPDWFAWLRGAR